MQLFKIAVGQAIGWQMSGQACHLCEAMVWQVAGIDQTLHQCQSGFCLAQGGAGEGAIGGIVWKENRTEHGLGAYFAGSDAVGGDQCIGILGSCVVFYNKRGGCLQGCQATCPQIERA